MRNKSMIAQSRPALPHLKLELTIVKTTLYRIIPSDRKRRYRVR